MQDFPSYYKTHFITRDKMEQIMSVNTLAPILLMQQLLKKKKLEKEWICCIYFVYFWTLLLQELAALCILHLRLPCVVLLRMLHWILQVKNIRVNAVCPGIINTHIWDTGTISEEQLSEEMKKYPLKRFGKPEEVAHAIIYFLSDASSFTTGTNLVIDGGFTLQ